MKWDIKFLQPVFQVLYMCYIPLPINDYVLLFTIYCNIKFHLIEFVSLCSDLLLLLL